MSQTDTVGALPHLPPAPDVPGPFSADDLMPVGTPVVGPPEGIGPAKTTAQVEQEMSKVAGMPEPELGEAPSGLVHLPGGWLRSDGELVRTAFVRELNGFDEERLSRLDRIENPATYITEMLVLGVEDLGGEKPTKDDIRSLLLGDRDALWLGIRIATYGPDVEYKLVCTECDTDDKPTESMVTIDLTEDVPVKELEDPQKQVYEVELRHGVAKVKLLDGYAQEKFSVNLGKKTQAEINTIMLANSVTEINGISTRGKEDAVRALSSQDRGTIMDFIVETQPGPELGSEIEVHCAKCDAEYPIILAPASLFRF